MALLCLMLMMSTVSLMVHPCRGQLWSDTIPVASPNAHVDLAPGYHWINNVTEATIAVPSLNIRGGGMNDTYLVLVSTQISTTYSLTLGDATIAGIADWSPLTATCGGRTAAAIVACGQVDVLLQRIRFAHGGGTSQSAGGAVFSGSAFLVLDDILFDGMGSVAGYGGLVYAEHGTVTATDVVVRNGLGGAALFAGAAVYTVDSRVMWTGGTLEGVNRQEGGSLFVGILHTSNVDNDATGTTIMEVDMLADEGSVTMLVVNDVISCVLQSSDQIFDGELACKPVAVEPGTPSPDEPACPARFFQHNALCLPCSECTEYEVVHTECNGTVDTVCSCEPLPSDAVLTGTLNDHVCAWTCASGFVLSGEGTCVSCPEGTYEVHGICVSCSYCGEYQEVGTACTATNDTVCVCETVPDNGLSQGDCAWECEVGFFQTVAGECLPCPEGFMLVNGLCLECSTTDAQCASDSGHAGWVSSCNGTGAVVDICFNSCDGDFYWHEDDAVCYECTFNDARCEAEYGSEAWYSTCDSGVQDGVCLFACGEEEYWNSTLASCEQCGSLEVVDVDLNGTACARQGVVMRFRGSISYEESHDGAFGLAIDTDGSVLVSGLFRSAIGADDVTVSTAGRNWFVARVDNNGTLSWLEHSSDDIFSLVVEGGLTLDKAQDTAYVATFSTASGEHDALLFAIDSKTASPIWEEIIANTGTEDNSGAGVHLDSNGGLYFVGHSHGDVQVGDAVFTGVGQYDMLVARYDLAGSVLWARHVGGSGVDRLRGMYSDGIGHVVVVGVTNDDITDGLQGDTLSAFSPGTKDAVVIMYDDNGNLLWTAHDGGDVDVYGWDAAISSDGGVYTCGWWIGNASFGGPVLHGGAGSDANDTVYMTPAGGLFSPSGYLVRRDLNGAFEWVLEFSSNAAVRAVDVDSDGFVYVGGSYSIDLTINEVGYGSSRGGRDAMVVKVAPDGTVVWAKTFGGDSYDTVNELVIDGPYVYVAGSCRGTVFLDNVLMGPQNDDATACVVTYRRSDGKLMHRCRGELGPYELHVIPFQGVGSGNELMPQDCETYSI